MLDSQEGSQSAGQFVKSGLHTISTTCCFKDAYDDILRKCLNSALEKYINCQNIRKKR